MDNSEYIKYINRVVPPTNDAEDDGTLAFLGLDTDRDTKTFSCPAKRQTELVGESFWILDYFGDIKTKDGSTKYLYKAKMNLDDPDELAFKVWTGSPECWAVLDKLAELDKFPRKVTLCRRSKGAMYFR